MDETDQDARAALHVAGRELRWTQQELEHATEALQRVRRQRARLREQNDQLAAALAETLAASYGADDAPRRGLLARRTSSGPDPDEAALVREVEASDLFDGAYYLLQQSAVVRRRVSPAAHYVRHGNRERLDPGPRFSTRAYLEAHPEVEDSGVPALVDALRRDRTADGARR